MGLDFDGALCEYISVPFEKVIATKSQDPRLIAYLEPIPIFIFQLIKLIFSWFSRRVYPANG